MLCVLPSVNQMLLSGPTVMPPVAPSPEGRGNDVTPPLMVISTIEWKSDIKSVPDGPGATRNGWSGTGNCVNDPLGVMRPILLLPDSENQIFPSLPKASALGCGLGES